MSLLRPKIVDARGKRLPLLTPLDRLGARERLQIERGVEVDEQWTWRKLAVVIAVLLPVLVALGLVVPAVLHFRLMPRWSVFVLAIPIGLAPPLTMMALMRSMFARSYRDAYIRVAVCPSCGYDIREALAEPDGCRICPECGGAWRKSDV